MTDGLEREGEARPRVLVVDDELYIRELVRRILRRTSDVETVGEGAAAVDLVLQRRFDLVVCDVMMAPVDGPAVLARVATSAPELAARFVFMTGGATGLRFETFLREWTGAVLYKPFAAAELADLVAGELRRLGPLA